MKQWTKPAALVCLLTLISCSSADKGEAYIIAAPVPLAFAQQNTCFLDGVKLAEEDIQSMDLPVSLQVQVDDDNADFSTAIALAQKYISNPSIIGVVGHWYSDICLPISELYKKGEKTLIVPTVSISALTNPPSDYLFRNIPDDSQIARKMCDYAVNGGVKTAVIYYEDSTYGFRMSAGLELYANSAGIDIADRVCNPSMTRDLPDLLHKWKVIGAEAVFIVSNLTEGSEFMNALSGLGFEGAYICGDGMDSAATIDLLAAVPNDITICSVFSQDSAEGEMRAFLSRFEAEFNKKPDVWAFQGYDSVMLIAEAVKNGAKTSSEVSEYLRTTAPLNSVYGQVEFDQNHEITGRAIYIKKIISGAFEYV